MKGTPCTSGKYRAVWLFALFDLPVTTAARRRAYAKFRKLLLRQGFCKLQFSVYARYFANEEASYPMRAAIRDQLPAEGQVRLLLVTDGQFGKQQVFQGKNSARVEDAPRQYMLF
jgi:CRISPR-associated protein Cas2